MYVFASIGRVQLPPAPSQRLHTIHVGCSLAAAGIQNFSLRIPRNVIIIISMINNINNHNNINRFHLDAAIMRPRRFPRRVAAPQLMVIARHFVIANIVPLNYMNNKSIIVIINNAPQCPSGICASLATFAGILRPSFLAMPRRNSKFVYIGI